MKQYLEEIDRLLSEPLASVYDREQCAFRNLLNRHQRRVVLFGAGNLGRKALACLRGIDVEPLAFVDNGETKWGMEVDGVPVLSPTDAAARYGSSALFMVSIWSEGHYYPETRALLERLGCRFVEHATWLHWGFSDRLLPHYCQDLPHKVLEEKAEVRKAGLLWADDGSRQEYLNQMRWRVLGAQDGLAPPVAEESYFLDGLYRVKDGEVFVDAGAYIGAVTEQVVRRNPEFGRIIAIEPEPANFERLSNWIRAQHPRVASRIRSLKIAVGAKRQELRFRANRGDGACLADDGNIIVECAPLDELLAEEKPTFIKMDLEGAEFDALAGSRLIIQAHRPILSICVYHKQNDLWRIPLFIKTMAEEYQLFLRPHGGDGWQLVCYAVPPERLRTT